MPVYKKVNKNFFKKWSFEMAYVLGFFAADGYITLNKRGANFWCIQIADKTLLESIKAVIRSEHKISVRPKRGNNSSIYRLQIGSKSMCNDLRKIGFAERKSKTLVLPNVPERYLSQFVRGYFDGDGNVWAGLIHKKRGVSSLAILTAFTSCSLVFLKQLHQKLLHAGIHGGSIYKAKGNYARLQFSTHDSLKLYDFMYNRHTGLKNGLFLHRKKSVFEKYRRSRNVRP